MTNTLTPGQAEDAVQKAEEERERAHDAAAEAADAVTELQNKVRTGDTAVAPKHLADAEAKAKHAELLADSHAAKVAEAHSQRDQARLNAVSSRVSDRDARLTDAIDRLAAPMVHMLAELLSEIRSARDEQQACRRALGGIPRDTATPPKNVANHVPQVSVPDVDDLLGEMFAAAGSRAFPEQGFRDAWEAITSNTHRDGERIAGGRAHTLADRGRRPRYLTSERVRAAEPA